MKSTLIRTLAFSAWIIGGTSILSAQQSGVFKSYTDFTSGKMEYGINCATEKHKIKLNDFLGKDHITVIHEGKPYELKKNEIWGFQLCDEKIVRFQGKNDYEVADKSILWIYAKQITISGSPKAGGPKTVTKYYFSRSGEAKIVELNLINLKSAFPDNHMLHDAIDTQFKSDGSLNEFDEYHKQYKINRFLDSQGIK